MAFFYRDGKLKIGASASEGLDIEILARASARGPVYIYDLDDIERRYRALDGALTGIPHHIHYAMKANSHPAILEHLASLGAGVDTVSGGEIQCALDAGFTADQIIF